jgi:hypothetical protein
MARVVITKPNGERFEISDLSISDIKSLAGLENIPSKSNGASGHTFDTSDSKVINYGAFYRALTPIGKKLVKILRENPSGIDAEDVVKALGFETASQIGGLVGGGWGKTGPKYGVKLDNVYRRTVSHENGVRKVTYFPGKNIDLVVE